MESKLKLLEPTKKRNNWGAVIWKCICSCGKITEHAGYRVRNKQIRSCGCLRKSKDVERSGTSAIYTMYKYNANKRNIDFLLSFNEFKSLIVRNCNYCGIEPREQNKKGFGILANGIDRKNPTIGYVLDNCVTCCSVCNMAKGTLDYNSFKEWIVRVYNFINSEN